MKTAIIGAGAWGTALAIIATQANGRAMIWGRDSANMEAMDRARENKSRLPGIALPEGLSCIASPVQLRQAECLIIATPAQALRATMTQLRDNLRPGIPALIAAKGIERGSGLFMSEVLREAAPRLEPFCLSGPSFARDVAAGLPTAVALAGDTAHELAAALSTPTFRIYANSDLRGAEIGGAVKNVLAIACGISDGLGLGESARAALTTRGFAELIRLGEALGARRGTLLGLSGLGDLLLTCASAQSRNFRLGVRLARGETAQDPSGAVVEGAWTAPVVVELARKHALEMPVAEAVSRVLDGTSTPDKEVSRLLGRPLRAEF